MDNLFCRINQTLYVCSLFIFVQMELMPELDTFPLYADWNCFPAHHIHWSDVKLGQVEPRVNSRGIKV